MKKSLFVMALVTMATGMIGCSSDNDVFNSSAIGQNAHEDFKQAFLEEFGQPSANQDWGFASVQSNARTRAGETGKTDEELIEMGENIVNLTVDELSASGFKRIVAEDLAVSAQSDFDYNDIVFDAKHVKNADSEGWSTFYLIVRATGAHKQIFVGDEEAEGRFEVHELFGVEQKSFVNTVGKVKEKDNGAYWAEDHDPVFVELKVKKTGAEEPRLIDIPIYVDNNALPLTAKRGEPAEKLCVDCDYSWVVEKTKMKKWYPQFEHYTNCDEPEYSWWHSYYWDNQETEPVPDGGTGYSITLNGKEYIIVFKQENHPDGTKYFSTYLPIHIFAYEKSGDTKTLLPLGQENTIKVLCNGDSGHFSRSISYNTDETATLVTPDNEKKINHAPVTITLNVGGSSVRVESDIYIRPNY